MALAGCGRENPGLSAERDDSSYREGQQLEREGRSEEALNAYLKVIARRGDSAPESHLEAGIIEMGTIKDQIAAIYHFRKYLELEPNAKQAPYVLGLIEAAKREFAKTLPGRPLENQSERMGYLDQIASLQRDNDRLQHDYDALKASTAGVRAGDSSSPMIRTPVAESPISFAPLGAGASALPEEPPPVLREVPMGAPALAVAPLGAPPAVQPEVRSAPPAKGALSSKAEASGTRRHVVVRGDTLSSISMKYYGNRSRVGDIVAANRGVLPDKTTPLKLGMTLNLP